MNVANNHSHDFLEAGMASTHQALRVRRVAYTGLPGQITVVERNGVRVAFIGVAPYPWSQSLRDISATARSCDARARRPTSSSCSCMPARKAPTSTHAEGPEHAYGEFRGSPRAFAHAMIDAGARAVLGSGPHVVRGIERYKGRLVAYSLGNFAGWGNFGTSGTLGLSGLLTVRVDRRGEVLGGRWLSLKLAGSGAPAIDPEGRSVRSSGSSRARTSSTRGRSPPDGTLAAGVSPDRSD